MNTLRSFGFLLTDTSRRYVHRFEQRARAALGLTLPQCKALVNLARHEGISQSQLGELADIEPMTLVRILDRMERDGWVERCSHPTDRRARRLYLKDKGRALMEEIWRLSDLTRGEALADIRKPQCEQMVALLGKIRDNLAALEPLPAAAAERPAGRSRGAAGAARVSRERAGTKP